MCRDLINIEFETTEYRHKMYLRWWCKEARKRDESCPAKAAREAREAEQRFVEEMRGDKNAETRRERKRS